MKIIFLGTCHGAPERNRYFTSMLLEVGDNLYLIDAGAPFLYLMQNRELSCDRLKAGFITHMHGDHSLHACLYAVMCLGKLYLPEKQDIKSMEDLIYFMHLEGAYENNKGCCEIKNVQEGLFYDDGIIEVTAIPTKHMERGKTFAYMIEAEGKRVLFTGDLAFDFSDYPQITEELDFDAVVCELTHFEVETAIPKLNKTRTKKLLFNHVRDDKVAVLKKNEVQLKVDYYITNDGDEIDI